MTHIRLENKNNISIRFEGVQQLLTYLKEKEGDTTLNPRRLNSHDGKYSFRGTHNFQEAIDLIQNGDMDILNKLTTEISKIEPKYIDSPYIPDTNGSFFDVAKVLEGEPEAWYRKADTKVDIPTLEIVLGIGYLSGVSKNTIIHNSAILISYIKGIEAKGIRVKLIGRHYNDNCNGTHSETIVVIKDYYESFNYTKLSGVIHPSFFRRLLVRVRELNIPNLSSDYGRTIYNNAIEISKESSIHEYFKGRSNE